MLFCLLSWFQKFSITKVRIFRQVENVKSKGFFMNFKEEVDVAGGAAGN
jgi:uncharacterized protein (DUF2147 family)